MSTQPTNQTTTPNTQNQTVIRITLNTNYKPLVKRAKNYINKGLIQGFEYLPNTCWDIEEVKEQ